MDINKIFNYIKEAFLSGKLDFLEDLKSEDILPVAMLLNVSAENLTTILNMLPKIFKNQLSIKEILPKILPILIGYFAKSKLNSTINNSQKPTYSPTFDNFGDSSTDNDSQENFDNEKSADVILQTADDDIFYSLNSYFDSSTAS